MNYTGKIQIRITHGVRDSFGGRGPVINGTEYSVAEEEIFPRGEDPVAPPNLPPLKVGDTVELSSDTGLNRCRGTVVQVLDDEEIYGTLYRVAIIEGTMRVPTRAWLEGESSVSGPVKGITSSSEFSPNVENPRWSSSLWKGELTREEAREVIPPAPDCGPETFTITADEIRRGWPNLAEMPAVGSWWDGRKVVPENAVVLEIEDYDDFGEKPFERVKIDGQWYSLPKGRHAIVPAGNYRHSVYLDRNINLAHHRAISPNRLREAQGV